MTTLDAPPSASTAARTAPASSPIPLTRLVTVELRKLVDTRAGFWLSASIGVFSVVVAVSMLIALRDDPAQLSFGNFFGNMNIPLAIILPVMAILLVTSEWSQRTSLTTFTMEPRRERIVAAKLITALIAAIAAVGIALITAAIATPIARLALGAPAGTWEMPTGGIFNAFVVQLFGLLLGFGFAALLRNTPAAIVAYFALPTLLTLASELVPWFRNNLGEWVDSGLTLQPFYGDIIPDGGEWARFAVTSLVWIGIPLVFGIRGILRSEVK